MEIFQAIQEFARSLDWKIITPLVTFILGFFLNELKGSRDRKRQINNLKTVLFWEIALNNYFLERIKELGNDSISMYKKAYVIQSLESSVYDAYLSQINKLNPDELDPLLMSYNSLNRVKDMAERFLISFKESVVNKPDEEIDEELLSSRLITLQNSINSCRKFTSTTLSMFVQGREDLLKKVEILYSE